MLLTLRIATSFLLPKQASPDVAPFSWKETVEMVTSHHSLLLFLLIIVACHLACAKSRYGRYQQYDKKCQLRLYAVPEFRVSNDIIDSDIRVRRQRRNDKSLSTIGKDDLKSFFFVKKI